MDNKYSQEEQEKWIHHAVKTGDEMSAVEFIAWVLGIGGFVGTLIALWLMGY